MPKKSIQVQDLGMNELTAVIQRQRMKIAGLEAENEDLRQRNKSLTESIEKIQAEQWEPVPDGVHRINGAVQATVSVNGREIEFRGDIGHLLSLHFYERDNVRLCQRGGSSDE